MYRRLAPVLVVAVAICFVFAVPATNARAVDPPTCIKVDPMTGLCIVTSSGDQSDGGTTSTTDDRSEGGGDGTCHWDTSNGHLPGGVPCTAGGGVWNGFCYLSLADPQPPKGLGQWLGHTTGAIYVCSAAGPGEPEIGIVGLEFWYATPPRGLGPDPAELAEQALNTLTIPGPTAGRYPSGTLQDGRPYTLVSTYTWYWTSPNSFKTLSATATAGGFSSTVTVTPAALVFTPGDGGSAVSCPGPGVAWAQGDGVWAASPSGCDYRYPHSSIHDANAEVTATYGIRWAITWTSTIGVDGTLPDLTTTAAATFVVAEAESVVTQ